MDYVPIDMLPTQCPLEPLGYATLRLFVSQLMGENVYMMFL